MLPDLLAAFSQALSPTSLLAIILAGIFGLMIGAVPGMTATLGAALLIPFTYFLDPIPAIASIISMSAMAIFAGDVPGALLRMPGTPSSAAYTEDAFALTQQGKGALALGVSLVSSVLGGVFGSVALIFLAPILGRLAMTFSSYEYFWVAVLGLTTAVIISQGSQLKGMIALLLGLLISTVGLDVTLGQPRFTFGMEELYRGIDFIPAMIGLFGLSEILRNVMDRQPRLGAAPHVGTRHMVSDSLRALWRNRGKAFVGSGVGSVVGALPGAGADIGAWIAYAVTKTVAKDKAKFGKGALEPIVGAASANNAALGSSFVPTLAFGIPGDTITAIVIGVLMVKGIQPGPLLFTERASTLYALYITFIVANLVLLPLGFVLIKVSGSILRIPQPILLSAIVCVSIVGAYAINSGYLEVLLVVIFGALGFILERTKFPLAPVVLGIVLGPIIERNFMSSVVKTNWDFTEFFTRPVSAILIILTLLMLFYPLIQNKLARAHSK